MLIDALVSFITPGATLSMVAGAGVGIPSPNTIDLLGLGVGQAPTNIIGQPGQVFGSDPGIGWPRAQCSILVSTALTTGTGATLNIKYQGAADTGAGGGYLPGAWDTIVESGEIPVTEMDAAGDLAWQFDFEPVVPLNFRPRYLRLLFQVSDGDTFTAGAVQAPVSVGVDQHRMLQTPKNYTAYRAT